VNDVKFAFDDPRVVELLARRPPGWTLVESRGDGNAYAQSPRMLLRVIESFSIEQDDRYWQHISLSRPERIPSWSDIRAVKDAFLGSEREAYVVLPPAARYVNLHPHVLHLWSCLDGPVLPEFDRGLGTI